MKNLDADKVAGSVIATAGCLWLLWAGAIITTVCLAIAALAKYVFS